MQLILWKMDNKGEISMTVIRNDNKWRIPSFCLNI